MTSSWETSLPCFLTTNATGTSPHSSSVALDSKEVEIANICKFNQKINQKKEEEKATLRLFHFWLILATLVCKRLCTLAISANAHTYPVTATSSISGCEINTASKSAGAICKQGI